MGPQRRRGGGEDVWYRDRCMNEWRVLGGGGLNDDYFEGIAMCFFSSASRWIDSRIEG